MTTTVINKNQHLSLYQDTCYHLTYKLSFLYHWMTVTKLFFQVCTCTLLQDYFHFLRYVDGGASQSLQVYGVKINQLMRVDPSMKTEGALPSSLPPSVTFQESVLQWFPL